MGAPAPTVSVMMTVYNAASYVETAVESILAQTHRDFELIVIDDGSVDGSRGILETLSRRDARIRLVSRANTGICQARNEALGLSRGEYVVVMDADDIASPQRIERQLAFMQAHPEVSVAGAWFDVIDAGGRYLTCLKPPLENEAIQQALLSGHTAICQPTSILRREALEAVGGFDESLDCAEDLDVYLKLGERGQLANIPEALVRYRMHAASTTARKREAALRDRQAVCSRAWERRGLEPRQLPADFWRPDDSRASRNAFLVKCGWWAFSSGQRRTATLYALKAVAATPYRTAGWRLLLCSLLKSVGKPEPVACSGSSPRIFDDVQH